jgi:hypothetical protein
MDLVYLRRTPYRKSCGGKISQEGRKELRHLCRWQEHDRLGFTRVAQLIMCEETENVRYLLGCIGENCVILLHVSVDGECIIGDGVDENVVPVQRRASDLLDTM